MKESTMVPRSFNFMNLRISILQFLVLVLIVLIWIIYLSLFYSSKQIYVIKILGNDENANGTNIPLINDNESQSLDLLQDDNDSVEENDMSDTVILSNSAGRLLWDMLLKNESMNQLPTNIDSGGQIKVDKPDNITSSVPWNISEAKSLTHIPVGMKVKDTWSKKLNINKNVPSTNSDNISPTNKSLSNTLEKKAVKPLFIPGIEILKDTLMEKYNKTDLTSTVSWNKLENKSGKSSFSSIDVNKNVSSKTLGLDEQESVPIAKLSDVSSLTSNASEETPVDPSTTTTEISKNKEEYNNDHSSNRSTASQNISEKEVMKLLFGVLSNTLNKQNNVPTTKSNNVSDNLIDLLSILQEKGSAEPSLTRIKALKGNLTEKYADVGLRNTLEEEESVKSSSVSIDLQKDFKTLEKQNKMLLKKNLIKQLLSSINSQEDILMNQLATDNTTNSVPWDKSEEESGTPVSASVKVQVNPSEKLGIQKNVPSTKLDNVNFISLLSLNRSENKIPIMNSSSPSIKVVESMLLKKPNNANLTNLWKNKLIEESIGSVNLVPLNTSDEKFVTLISGDTEVQKDMLTKKFRNANLTSSPSQNLSKEISVKLSAAHKEEQKDPLRETLDDARSVNLMSLDKSDEFEDTEY